MGARLQGFPEVVRDGTDVRAFAAHDAEIHFWQGDARELELVNRGLARCDLDFLSGPERSGVFNPPSPEQMALKEKFGADRRARWFDR